MENRQETDLMRQVREAFDMVILDDRFRTDEQRQLAMLEKLREMLDKDVETAEKILDRGTQEQRH